MLRIKDRGTHVLIASFIAQGHVHRLRISFSLIWTQLYLMLIGRQNTPVFFPIRRRLLCTYSTSLQAILLPQSIHRRAFSAPERAIAARVD